MNLKISRVLITGGAGFIGSELARQACESGAHVTVVDNLVNGKRQNLDGLSNDQVNLVACDIRDIVRMSELVQGNDVVFHLACLGVRHSIHSPVENHEVNATATLNLLRIARNYNVKRFVYVSSSEVYGTARWAPMTEEHPTYPMTVYGASKLAGECYTRAFYSTHQYPTVVVRPFNTYGPNCHHEGDSGEVIPKFLLRCMAGKPMIIFGDGSQTRDFTYVSDTAKGILAAGIAEYAVGQTINLGSGAEVTVKDLADEIRHALQRPGANVEFDNPRPGDVLRLYADNSKAKQLLDFHPNVPLKQGLLKLRDWYVSCGRSIETLLEDEIVHNWNPAETHARF